MNTQTLIEKLQNGELDDRLLDIYVDNKLMDYQRNRYIVAIKKFEDLYDAGEVEAKLVEIILTISMARC